MQQSNKNKKSIKQNVRKNIHVRYTYIIGNEKSRYTQNILKSLFLILNEYLLNKIIELQLNKTI